jgi:hypothetical protein
MSGRILAGLGLIALAACAGNGSSSLAPMGNDLDRGQPIRVENAMAVSLRVYSLEEGSETMLGRVPASGDVTLRLHTPVNGNLQLIARPSAGLSQRQHVSEPIQIMPGQQVTWKLRFSPGVGGVPQLSSFHVAPCLDVGCD